MWRFHPSGHTYYIREIDKHRQSTMYWFILIPSHKVMCHRPEYRLRMEFTMRSSSRAYAPLVFLSWPDLYSSPSTQCTYTISDESYLALSWQL